MNTLKNVQPLSPPGRCKSKRHCDSISLPSKWYIRTKTPVNASRMPKKKKEPLRTSSSNYKYMPIGFHVTGTISMFFEKYF
jgi:hypothetical protein